MADVTVIIVSFNSAQYLPDCVAALRQQSLSDFHAIIVDNNSTDGSLTAIAGVEADPRFKLMPLTDNLGFAAGNNRALASVTTELVAFLNPDTVPSPEWLAMLVAAATRYPQAASFGSAQFMMDASGRLDGVGDAYFALGVPWRGGYRHPAATQPGEGEIFSACAAASLHRTAAVRQAGAFDEHFFCYCEDVDLGFRLRLLGHSAMHIPTARVRHAGGGSAGRGSDFELYHGVRNLVWVYVKNMPALLFWTLLPGHVLVLSYLFLRYAALGRAGVVARGLRDAACGLPAVGRERRRVQAARRVPLVDIVQALCWSPVPLWRRAPYVRLTTR